MQRMVAKLALLFATCVLIFGGGEWFIRAHVDDLFYRAHERYANRGQYRSNLQEQVNVSHGDLVSMDPALSRLAEPHTSEFITDSLGYRNSGDYDGQSYAFLGDSFVAGVGNTHTDLLASQFNRLGGPQAYSLGYPGEPTNYESHAGRFLRDHDGVRFVWFLFEGNDLVKEETEPELREAPSRLSEIGKYLTRRIPFLTPRVLTIRYRAARASLSSRGEPKRPSPVVVYPVGGQEVGFLRSYITMTTIEGVEFRTLGNEEILARTACVFVIPAKFRVYAPWIEGAPALPASSPAVREVTEYFSPHDIPVVDLHPTMQAAAKEQLERGRLLYWRDDTHWNGLGVASVLDPVEACITRDSG